MTLCHVTSFSITEQALSFIIQESKNKYPYETGGILVGYLKTEAIRITNVIGPGPKAIHKRSSFLRDGEFCQIELDSLFEKMEGKVDYLGEWHSHTMNTGPSTQDINSMLNIARDTKYALSNPVMGLCIKKAKRWDFSCYINYRARQGGIIELARVIGLE